ncbi:hypothetical protein LNTAR_24863 [Lentisphaera araneosa HTCC2155]|uniref:Uncharacterized protein n=1 Tax=Lentisphaera araneosa HTCC2155 TaxID=313628 RepID=A6DSY0_9BACT|nr:hypothetical protein LNTAR_24863 [Lentisphaera araneosa HTCC2155]
MYPKKKEFTKYKHEVNKIHFTVQSIDLEGFENLTKDTDEVSSREQESLVQILNLLKRDINLQNIISLYTENIPEFSYFDFDKNSNQSLVISLKKIMDQMSINNTIYKMEKDNLICFKLQKDVILIYKIDDHTIIEKQYYKKSYITNGSKEDLR